MSTGEEPSNEQHIPPPPPSNRGLFILVMVAILLFAAVQAQTVITAIHACHQGNQIVINFEKFIDGQVERSRVALQAIIDSPTASKEEKSAARSNRDSLVLIVKQEHEQLTLQSCSYPPS